MVNAQTQVELINSSTDDNSLTGATGAVHDDEHGQSFGLFNFKAMRFEVAVLVAVAGAADSTASLETSPPPPATHCGAWAKGVSLNGHDITFQVLPSAAACCELCGK